MVSFIAAYFKFMIRVGLWLWAKPLMIILPAAVVCAVALEFSWLTDGAACGLWRPLPVLLPVMLVTAPVFVRVADLSGYSPVKLLLILLAVTVLLAFVPLTPGEKGAEFSSSNIHRTCLEWGVLWIVLAWCLALAGLQAFRLARKLRDWRLKSRAAKETRGEGP